MEWGGVLEARQPQDRAGSACGEERERISSKWGIFSGGEGITDIIQSAIKADLSNSNRRAADVSGGKKDAAKQSMPAPAGPR